MSMVKTILLGSAAALVAFTANAADLPRKSVAAPAPTCGFGAGFFLIPGTDTCLQIGGWVQSLGIYSPVASSAAVQALNTRSRAEVTFDARTQTSAGVLRSVASFQARRGFGTQSSAFPNAGANGDQAVSTWLHLSNAYVQYAGFTAGLADNPFNFTGYHSNAIALYHAPTVSSGTQLAYTASLGGGVTATLAAVDSRYTQIGQLAAASVTTAGVLGVSGAVYGVTAPFAGLGRGVVHGGGMVPDFQGVLNVTQSWGAAQLMGTTHYVRQTDAFAPATALGYAVGAGVRVNLPMMGAGDSAYLSAVYTKGATNYIWDQGNQENYSGQNSTTPDAITNATGGLTLTNAYTVYGSVRHNWNASVYSSLYGGYTKVDLGSDALASDVKQWSVGTNVGFTLSRGFVVSLETTYRRAALTTQAGVTGADVNTLQVGYSVRRAF